MTLSLRPLLAAVLALCLAIPGAVVLLGADDAAAYSGISVDLDHPSYAAKGSKLALVLIISGGPAGEIGGNFTYRAELDGLNTTGAAITPSTGTSQSGVFKLNLTLPTQAPQTLKILINATSKEWKSGTSTHTESTFEIKVVDPIVITATVHNAGTVDARNVTAKFYADGSLLTSMIFNVTAGSSASLEYNWTFATIKSGKHVVTVTVDDSEGVVEFSDGNNVFSQTIYVGEQGNPAGVVLVIGVIIASILVALMFLAKPPKRSKKF